MQNQSHRCAQQLQSTRKRPHCTQRGACTWLCAAPQAPRTAAPVEIAALECTPNSSRSAQTCCGRRARSPRDPLATPRRSPRVAETRRHDLPTMEQLCSERWAAREGGRFELHAHLQTTPVRMSTSRASGNGEAPSPDKPAHRSAQPRRESRDLPGGGCSAALGGADAATPPLPGFGEPAAAARTCSTGLSQHTCSVSAAAADAAIDFSRTDVGARDGRAAPSVARLVERNSKIGPV